VSRKEDLAERLLAWNERRIDRACPKASGPLDPDEYPWTKPIADSYKDIRAEVDAIVSAGVQLPSVEDVVGSYQGNDGRWNNFILYSYGQWVDVNVARAPRTTELLRTVPGLQVGGFTVLGAGAHLPRHRGPNRGGLRYQVGVRVPGPPGACRIQVGEEVHVWREGGTLLFDDAVEHEAWNDSHEDRYVLFIQFTWPLPGLTGAVNRVVQRGFGLAARHIPARVADLDRVLNG
jgi:beta-hydroxylase